MKKTFFLLLLIPYFTFSQTIDSKFVTVRGISEKNITPDWIELTIVFSETENIKRDNELEIKENDLKKLIKSFQIDFKDLKVDNFSAKRYGYYKSSSNKVRMSKSYKLKLTQIYLTDSLIIELFKIGANEVLVTNLHSNKLNEIKLEATKEALDNAKIKAETMADYIGVSLVEVLEIKEYNPEYRSGIFENNYAMRKSSVMMYNVAGGTVQTDGEIGIRRIRIKYMVDVKYRIK